MKYYKNTYINLLILYYLENNLKFIHFLINKLKMISKNFKFIYNNIYNTIIVVFYTLIKNKYNLNHITISF